MPSPYNLRSRKRRKLLPPSQPTSPDPSLVLDRPLIYLDLLNVDALENIARFLSERPRRPDWLNFLPVSDLVALYKTGGALADFCRTLFTSPNTEICFGRAADGLNSPQISNMDWYYMMPHILSLGAANFHTVVFENVPRYMRNKTWIRDCLVPHCGSLRNLNLRGVSDRFLFDDILALCGARLEFVGAQCTKKMFISSIARHCRALRRVALYGSHVKCAVLWQELGHRLEEISFDTRMHTHVEIAQIRRYCREVRRLTIFGFRVFHPDIADLYASYGDQLEFANLHCMDARLFARVAESCPKAKISSRFSTDIGAKFSALGLRFDVGFVTFGSWASIAGLAAGAGACFNLRVLHMTNMRDRALEIVQGVLDKPKPNLEVLRLDNVGKDAPRVLDFVAQKVTSLNQFMFSGPLPLMDAFRVIVARNPGLTRADIDFFGIHLDEEEDDHQEFCEAWEAHLVDVIDTFVDAKALRELRVNQNDSYSYAKRIAYMDRETIQAVCSPLFRRNVAMMVDHLSYVEPYF